MNKERNEGKYIILQANLDSSPLLAIPSIPKSSETSRLQVLLIISFRSSLFRFFYVQVFIIFIWISVITCIATLQILLSFTIHITVRVISLKHGPDLKIFKWYYFSYWMLCDKLPQKLKTKHGFIIISHNLVGWQDSAR